MTSVGSQLANDQRSFIDLAVNSHYITRQRSKVWASFPFVPSTLTMGVLQWLLVATSTTFNFLSLLDTPPTNSPVTCLSNSTSVVDLVSCLQAYVVPSDYYTEASYNAAQPTAEQEQDWALAIQALLDVDSEQGCTTERVVPAGIRDAYSVSTFQEGEDSAPYCVLYEHTAKDDVYMKGWGFMLTRMPAEATTSLHLSAPHPHYDMYTPEQAGSVFSSVGARSLAVAGRRRTAWLGGQSPCIHGKAKYYATDPAHNDVRSLLLGSFVY